MGLTDARDGIVLQPRPTVSGGQDESLRGEFDREHPQKRRPRVHRSGDVSYGVIVAPSRFPNVCHETLLGRYASDR
jgi:hypothetical protein